MNQEQENTLNSNIIAAAATATVADQQHPGVQIPAVPVSPLTSEPNAAELLNQRIQAYLATHKIDLAIMTPTYGFTCNIDYVICLMNTVHILQTTYGIATSVLFCKNDSLVSRARNNLVAKAMARRDPADSGSAAAAANDKKCTHLLFIDSDIVWNPIDILKLLIADKDLIGGVYPKKKYNFDKLLRNPSVIPDMLAAKQSGILKDMDDLEYLQCKLVDCNANFVSESLEIENNICELRHIATGFMLIKRSVIEAMALHFPETKYSDDCGFLTPDEQHDAYALFDCAVEDGHYLSEDWLFCNRWREMGGKVYADVSIHLCHVGYEYYKGNMLVSLL